MDYASVVWNPTDLASIDVLERVQRVFTSRLTGIGGLNYTGRLIFFGLVPLELRRLHFDLIMVYKIIYRLVDISFSEIFEWAPSQFRGHAFSCVYLVQNLMLENIHLQSALFPFGTVFLTIVFLVLV